jgi:hypothetical protein
LVRATTRITTRVRRRFHWELEIRLTVTDSMKSFWQRPGSAEPEAGFAWYAGI